MQFLRTMMDRARPQFEKGGRFERLYPLFEAQETFLFTPGEVTHEASHVRDGADLKRIMIMVVIALIPCIFMAMYNTGLQANQVYSAYPELAEEAAQSEWQPWLVDVMGFALSPESFFGCLFLGAFYFIPVMLMSYVVGGICEVVFAVIRKHEVNEGFLVTGMLFPLILPPTIPLWQVAMGVAFGVVIGKEIFGGTGMNILNPALTARAFLFFAYPAQISGDQVWTAVDGYSGATALGALQSATANVTWIKAIESGAWSWWDAFLGFIPGSMGETSTLACLLGAALLLITGVASWRIMAGVTVGSIAISLLLQAIGSETNALMNVPFYWHLVLGGWAFGMVFMATDPVTAAYTNTGRWVYGLFIGVLAILIRAVNPAYPEGMMLAILFMNVFSPLIDHVVVSTNIRRRLARHAAV